MKIKNEDKLIMTRYGATKLFTDYKKREQMTDEELLQLFDRIWSANLEALVLNAEKCEYKYVYERLNDYHKKYCLENNCEYKTFAYSNSNFAIQLRKDLASDELYLTNVWLIGVGDTNPRALFIEFESYEEKEAFKKLAKQLKMDASELGYTVLKKFMDLRNSQENS